MSTSKFKRSEEGFKERNENLAQIPRSPLMESRDLAWHWVVESLAGFNEADTSLILLLKDAICSIPNFTSNASETVRERVCLRFLEEWSSSGGADGTCRSISDLPSRLGPIREIDESQTCEEVLVKTARTHDKGRALLHGHEFHQFITHKRATLPKSSLDLLKESLIQSCCQVALSLMEVSGLSKSDKVNYHHRIRGGEFQNLKKHKISTDGGEMQQLNQSTAGLAPDSGNVSLQNDPSGSQQHSSDENVSDESDDDRRNHPHGVIDSSRDGIKLFENSSMPQPHLLKTANLKDGEVPSPKRSLAALTPETDNANFQEGSSSFRQNEHRHVVADVQTTNHLHREIDGVAGDDTQMMSIMPQLPCKESGSIHHAALNGKGTNGNTHVGEIGRSNGDPGGVQEMQSHSDGSDDLSRDSDPNDELFTAEKNEFLSSQVNANDDSIAGSWIEKCIKCDKGGQLLSCSSNHCSIAVHESCLGLLVYFDEKGLFYCPFCSYLRANSAYKKAKKVVREARKNLSAFISKNLGQVYEKEQPPTGAPRKTSQERVAGNVNKLSDDLTNQHQTDKSREDLPEAAGQCQKNKAANIGEGRESSRDVEVTPSVRICDAIHDGEVNNEKMVNNHQNANQVQHSKLIGSANLTNNDRLPCQGTVASTICQNAVNVINMRSEATDISDEPCKEMETSRSKSSHNVSKGKRKQKLKKQGQVKDDNDIERELTTSRTSYRIAKRRRHNAVIGETDLPQGTSGNHTRGNSSLGERRNSNRRTSLYSSSISLPNCRRTPLSWTTEEEQFLKEAVQKFNANSDGTLPWTKILESGHHVFHRTRQPVDLKDKWRNIKNKEALNERNVA